MHVCTGAVHVNGQERYLFVFSDVIIVTQPQKQKKGASIIRSTDAGQTSGLGERFIGGAFRLPSLSLFHLFLPIVSSSLTLWCARPHAGGGSGINDPRASAVLAPLSPDANDKKSRKSAKKTKAEKGSKIKDKGALSLLSR
jgi:hypothetical protein